MKLENLKAKVDVSGNGIIDRVFPQKDIPFEDHEGISKTFKSQFIVIKDGKLMTQDLEGNDIVLEGNRAGLSVTHKDEITDEQKGKAIVFKGKTHCYMKEGEKRHVINTKEFSFKNGDTGMPAETKPAGDSKKSEPVVDEGKMTKDEWRKRDMLMVYENSNSGACAVIASFVNAGLIKDTAKATSTLFNLIEELARHTTAEAHKTIEKEVKEKPQEELKEEEKQEGSEVPTESQE